MPNFMTKNVELLHGKLRRRNSLFFQYPRYQQIVDLGILRSCANVPGDIVGLGDQLAVGITGIQSQGRHGGGQSGLGACIGRIKGVPGRIITCSV